MKGGGEMLRQEGKKGPGKGKQIQATFSTLSRDLLLTTSVLNSLEPKYDMPRKLTSSRKKKGSGQHRRYCRGPLASLCPTITQGLGMSTSLMAGSLTVDPAAH